LFTPGFVRFLIVLTVASMVVGLLLARARERSRLEEDALVAFGGMRVSSTLGPR